MTTKDILEEEDVASLLDGPLFEKQYAYQEDLGSGSEGEVSLWQHTTTARYVAVKTQIPGYALSARDLAQEIRSMRRVRKHPHVVDFLGWAHIHFRERKSGSLDPEFTLALFYEFCDLGDINHYTDCFKRKRLHVPEMTAWKFLSDMTKACHWIHDSLDTAYLHGDIKPANVLVRRPNGMTGPAVPLLPDFKIADFSRLAPYPSKSQGPRKFCGTYEWGPPISERHDCTPKSDIYSIGACLPSLLWAIMPVMSFHDWNRTRAELGLSLVTLRRYDETVHRHRSTFPVASYPLNATRKMQVEQWDLRPHEAKQYSSVLNTWYSMLSRPEPKKRVSATTLIKYFVPQAEARIDVLAAKWALEKKIALLEYDKRSAHNQKNGLWDFGPPTEFHCFTIARRPNDV